MRQRLSLRLVAVGLCCLLAACDGAGGATEGIAAPQNLVDSAASEATAIIQQARATALVLEARAQATALIQQAAQDVATPVAAATRSLAVSSPTPAEPLASAELTPDPPAGAEAAAPAEAGGVPATSTNTVEILGVTYGADSGFIMVQYRAPPRVAQEWWQGRVSVVDEGTGAVYNEIPVIPKIGPLIGRPVEEGQLGYVMLVNAPIPLGPGALVTVALGEYTFEHIPVQ